MQTIGGREPLHGELGRFYDAIENPRKTRGELPILRDAELRSYLERRPRAHARGARRDRPRRHRRPPAPRRLRLRDAARPRAPAQRDDAAAAADGRALRAAAGRSWPGGRACLRRPRDGRGRGRRARDRRPAPEGFAYDNERPRHAVELAPFWIDRTPVTNGAWICLHGETGAEPPMYWERDGEGGWIRAAMGRREAVDPPRP